MIKPYNEHDEETMKLRIFSIKIYLNIFLINYYQLITTNIKRVTLLYFNTVIRWTRFKTVKNLLSES